MSEVSVNVSRDLTDVPKASSIRITLASSADLGQYESAMHELAYSIGMTMLMENKNFLYIADVGSETIEDFKAVTRQKEKARKPGIADASLEKIIAGKLQHFLSDQHSTARPQGSCLVRDAGRCICARCIEWCIPLGWCRCNCHIESHYIAKRIG
jgi:hypothetical protein